jgi:dipeptidyl aminopeptidase/acylaminoacyl peptidase
LVAYDSAAHGEVIAADPRYDIDDVELDPAGRPILAQLRRRYPETIALTPELRTRLRALRHELSCPIRVRSFDANSGGLVFSGSGDHPDTVYLQPSAQMSPSRLTNSHPNLDRAPLTRHRASWHIVRAPGAALDAFVVHPRSTYSRGTVVALHGGPTQRDDGSFHLEGQWLADLGFTVVRLNFRGSSGYGRHMLNAADRAYATAARHDVLATVTELQRRGVTPAPVTVMGWSLGGTLSILCAEHTEIFAACVGIVAILDLTRLITSTSPYRVDQLIRITEQFGDPDTDPAPVREASPLLRATRPLAPTLLIVGQTDRFAPPHDAHRWAGAQRAYGNDCRIVELPAEGHTIRGRANRRNLYTAVDEFLTSG